MIDRVYTVLIGVTGDCKRKLLAYLVFQLCNGTCLLIEVNLKSTYIHIPKLRAHTHTHMVIILTDIVQILAAHQ